MDTDNECILAPVFGQLVPFHISTIKNVTKDEAMGKTELRINFITPDASWNSKFKLPSSAKPTNMFIQELTYRSSKGSNLAKVFMEIKDLRKRFTTQEKVECLLYFPFPFFFLFLFTYDQY